MLESTRPTSRRRRTMAAIVGAIAVGSTAIHTTTDAGSINPADLIVYLSVIGPDAEGVMNGLTIELWPSAATEPDLCSDEPEAFPSGFPVQAFSVTNCLDVAEGSYYIGLDGVPDGSSVTALCSSGTVQPNEVIPDSPRFDVLDNQFWPATCNLTVVQPVVLVDKVVDGGPASTDDFTIEVYSSSGELVATGVDPSSAACPPENDVRSVGDPSADTCAVIAVPAGDLRLGETAVPGYLPTNVGCTPFGGFTEAFPEGIGEFSVSDDPLGKGLGIVLCEITNSYFEGSVTVAKQVVNDDGGTATADDFTAELYLEGGALVESGACAADGSCIDTDLPIGDYRVGESGPEGYASTVACTVTGGSVPEIGTVPPSIPLFDEAIAGESAAFTLQPEASVACVITNDDIAPAIGVLPPTGTNRQPLVLALVLLALGGSLVVVRRRTI